jgi:TolB-like protein/Tfp pilus assembly protein PilF
VLVAVGVSMFLRDRPAEPERSAPAAGAAPVRSLAVLPLVNLSGDATQDHFADGLTDELIATFGRLPGLRVTSRTSVTQFKAAKVSLRDIARQLNVDAVLEGTVQVAGGGAADAGERRVRINARLIHAGTDTQLWSQSIERALTDVLAIQHDLARAIVRDVRMPLEPGALLESPAPRGNQNAAAQEAYLEGRMNMVNASSDSLVRARRVLERAVSLDTAFARAHASLALCYLWLEQTGVLDPPTSARLASEAARRALQLDPNLPEAHHALADVLLFHEWDWQAAGVEYARTLELNANYTAARRDYAWYLAALGRSQEAVQQAREAEINDSLNPDARAAVAMMLYFNREYDAAIGYMQRAISLAPERPQQHAGLARAYSATQNYPAAIREIETAVRLSKGIPVYAAELARVHAAAGNGTRARQLLRALQAREKDGQVTVPPIVYAWVYVALGERDEALRLVAAQKERTPLMLWAAVDPRFDAIRGDPRFAQAISALGLPQAR